VFYKTIEEFKDIITKFSVSKYKKDDFGILIVAKVEFIDGSFLHIKDYLFFDGKRKYSYNWQDKNGNLISRWDNSPHHKDITTFPHHRHLKDKVIPSKDHNIMDIFKVIKTFIIIEKH